MKTVTYLIKGNVHDFKRIDKIKTRKFINYFESGNLIYFKENEFNYYSIAKEDIIEIKE